jgi:hypothetical protein
MPPSRCNNAPVAGPGSGQRRIRVRGAVLLLTLLGACSAPAPPRSSRPAAEVHAQLVALIPASIPDRAGWAADIQRAFGALDLPPSTENLCAALAVTAQESTYSVDPEVPNLARIARQEIYRRAAKLHVPQFVVNQALKLESPSGRSYAERLDRVRTEQELSLLFEDFIGEVPLGKRLFGSANPVRTGGPMQVGIDFAERHARRHGYPYDERSIRHAVFTRHGGLYFGIAHLLKYPSSYDRHLYRFADFNAGWYASRNAAFQAAVSAASGRPLALDGDLVLHGGRFEGERVGRTEAAVRSLREALGLSEQEIRRTLERGDEFEFEHTPLYQRVFELAERHTGKPLPRAVVPRIDLHSPKFSRKLTTAWFANRVQDRYQRCVNRAFGR